MAVSTIALVVLALLGHGALWVGFVNRIHATGFPRKVVKVCSAFGHVALVFAPLVAIGFWWTSDLSLRDWLVHAADQPAIWLYVAACWVIAVLTLLLWIQRRWLSKMPDGARSVRTVTVDIGRKFGNKLLRGRLARILAQVPGNQVLKLSIEEIEIKLPHLPAPLDGLSIAHLSDFHITGEIGDDFFAEIVRQTNELGADMIVIAGDIVDEIELFEWIPQIFGKLSAPLGVFFVLGNHDQFTGHASRMRALLRDAGFVDVGNRWEKIEARGAQIIIAGNEMPWFTPAPDLSGCPTRSVEHPQLRVLLSHTPDQFAWARRQEFDLMLAGHAHGGQIRLPIAGPIFCPSRYGVKYACGTFYAAPTVMHVSRGVSSELPLRLNCPPEVTKITMHAAND